MFNQSPAYYQVCGAFLRKNPMRSLVLSLLLVAGLAQADQGYNPATPQGAANRTQWFLPGQTQAVTADEFKTKHRGEPIAIYTHGCSGPYWPEEFRVIEYFTQQGYAVAWNIFTQRRGVGASCSTDLTQLNNNPESINPKRMAARLKELEAVHDWARTNTKAKDYVIGGWSEGGRTVGLWQRPVKAVIIFGMDCKYPGFWDIPKGQKTLIMHDQQDPWIEAKGRNGRSCANWFNSGWVTQVESANATHAPLPTQREYDLLTGWLSRLD